MALKLITPPSYDSLSLNEVKSQISFDGNEKDLFMANVIIPAAYEFCATRQRRAYTEQTWELWLDRWPYKDRYHRTDWRRPTKEYIQIPLPPLQSVEWVKYYDTDNIERTMDAAGYFVDTVTEPGRVVLGHGKSWPSEILRPANGIVVRFVAGNIAGQIPYKSKLAMLMLIAHWDQNREAVVIGSISKEVEFAVSALLSQDEVVVI